MGAEEKVNILLVDDQPGKLLGYEVILSELGENLIKAGSANDALEQLLKNDVAVVLVERLERVGAAAGVHVAEHVQRSGRRHCARRPFMRRAEFLLDERACHG